MHRLNWVAISVVMRSEPHSDDPRVALQNRQGLLNEPAGVELPIVLHVKDVLGRDVGVRQIDRLDLPYVLFVGKDQELRRLVDFELIDHALDDGVSIHVARVVNDDELLYRV